LRVRYGDFERQARLEVVDTVLAVPKGIGYPYAILTDNVFLFKFGVMEKSF